ncbi:hypothetical protein ABID16_004342 [Rhizobium aquaticum]|uniref:Uncharacterized protein n=1 Tax=Rhizobium aquaticum TaxID=1549636 RepID=A0ABV2J5T9_9HYPH
MAPLGLVIALRPEDLWLGSARSGWRGFSSAGSQAAVRLCITEATIDALSLEVIEHERSDTLFASTEGGWSPAAELAVSDLACRFEILVAATDRNSQSEVCADTSRRIAERAERLPATSFAPDDRNEDLAEWNWYLGPALTQGLRVSSWPPRSNAAADRSARLAAGANTALPGVDCALAALLRSPLDRWYRSLRY